MLGTMIGMSVRALGVEEEFLSALTHSPHALLPVIKEKLDAIRL